VSYETLLTSCAGGVARIVLNRPEVRNALSRTLIDELATALAAYEADRDARVIVISGAGDRAFCAGADLKGVRDRGTTLEARESFAGLAKILETIPNMRTPVVAQVHGYALAGGCGLAVG
jgi:enoyl-CoA hydratase/carnithine racemase